MQKKKELKNRKYQKLLLATFESNHRFITRTIGNL